MVHAPTRAFDMQGNELLGKFRCTSVSNQWPDRPRQKLLCFMLVSVIQNAHAMADDRAPTARQVRRVAVVRSTFVGSMTEPRTGSPRCQSRYRRSPALDTIDSIHYVAGLNFWRPERSLMVRINHGRLVFIGGQQSLQGADPSSDSALRCTRYTDTL